MSLRPPRAILLDAGETLLYARPSTPAIAVAVAREHGFTFNVTELTLAWGMVESDAQARLAAGLRPTLSREQSQRFWSWFYSRLLTNLRVSRDRHDDLASAFYERFTRLDTWHLYDDVRGCLDQLKHSSVCLVLVSNWESWLEPLLEYRKIQHYFDEILISGQVGCEKPDPEIFTQALEKSGVTANEAVHVGDSIPSDIEGAQSVGIRPILLDRSGSLISPKGVAVIRTLKDLPHLLDLA